MGTTFESELGDDLQVPGEKFGSFYKKMMHTVVLIKVEKLSTSKGLEPHDMIGGGMIIDPRGLVLTANHVVEKASKILMRCVDEHGFTLATLIYADKLQDMALIKRKGSLTSAGIVVDPSVFSHFVKFAPASSLVVGMDVYAISHPSSRIYSFARGQLAYPASVESDDYKEVDCLVKTSIRRRMMDCRGPTDRELQSYPNNLHVIQLNNIHGSPGSSGCPVFSSSGLVIGMEVFINNNFDFCLHSNVLKGFIKTGLKHVKEKAGEFSQVSGESSRGTGNSFKVLRKSAEGSNKRKSPMGQQREGQSRRISHPMLIGEGKSSKSIDNSGPYHFTKHDKVTEPIMQDMASLQLSGIRNRKIISAEEYALSNPSSERQKLEYDIEFTAEHVLPLLVPLLNVRELSDSQFNKLMLFVKDVLSKIEEKRGATFINSTTDNKVSSPVINGLHTEPLQRTSTVASSEYSNRKWGEDWTSITKGIAPVADPYILRETNPLSKQSMQFSPSTAAFSSSTSFGCQSVLRKKKWHSSDRSFDDIDPFANWSPKPSNLCNNIGSRNSATETCGIFVSNSAGRGLKSNNGMLSNAYKVNSNIQNPGGLGLNGSSVGLSEKTNALSGKLSTGLRSNFDCPVSHCMSERVPGTASIFSIENSVPAPRFAAPQTFAGGFVASQTFSGGRGCLQNIRHVASGTTRRVDQPPFVDLF